MANIQILRTKMSKTKDVLMTIGIDEKQHLDETHDMYFLRAHFDIRRVLEMVQPGTIMNIVLSKMGDRCVSIYRNDNEDIIKKSVISIIDFCKQAKLSGVAFNEHELRMIDISELTKNYDIDIYILTEK